MTLAHRQTALALALILAAGGAYRLGHLALRPSLTVDEAMLGLNIASRSYAELLRPLDYTQIAPLPYLWALRLATDLGGVNDVALRVPSLLAGLLLPFLVWRVARRLMDPGPALFGAALAALAPLAITYSLTAKQYAVDALVTVWLLDLALGAIERPERRAAWLWLVAGGVVALLCSLTAVFVLCGVGAALALTPGVRVHPSARWMAFGGMALWASVFVALYAGWYRAAAADPYLREFWEARFLGPAAFVSQGHGWKTMERLMALAFVPGRVASVTAYLLWALAVAGSIRLARTRGVFTTALLAGPLGVLLAAAALERYPISARLFLFVAPLVYLLIASGVHAVLQWWPRRAVARAVGAGVAAGLGGLALTSVSPRFHASRSRPLIQEVMHGGTSGQPIFIYAGAAPAWLFYTTDWQSPDTVVLRRLFRLTGPGGPGFHNAASRGRPVGVEEGAELLVTRDGRLELFGLAPGIQWLEGRRFSSEHPDSGWAAREAARIRNVADFAAWVLVVDPYPNTLSSLREALVRQRGVAEYTREERGAMLYRYLFPVADSGGS